MITPNAIDYCDLKGLVTPVLMVVIDTEEEFDWSCEFSRDYTAVKSMKWIARVQDIFDEYGITPTYVIDYPIVSQEEGYRPLLEVYEAGRCVIGAHLHPWVNPPYIEEVSRTNSFPGNLPYELESKKLEVLGQMIGEKFGSFPVIYKAGRYGVGPRTAEILEGQGYEVDLSVCPHMDWSSEGGPNFDHHVSWPYWFGIHRRMLELPLTSGYSGLLRQWGSGLHEVASRPALGWLHGVGIMARLGLLNKVRLTPEGFFEAELISLMKALYQDGLRVFNLAFHSPSVEPGNTPYVNSLSELESFLSCLRRVLDFFFGELSGQPTTPLDLKNRLTVSNKTVK
jgi:hypothetical protein